MENEKEIKESTAISRDESTAIKGLLIMIVVLGHNSCIGTIRFSPILIFIFVSSNVLFHSSMGLFFS